MYLKHVLKYILLLFVCQFLIGSLSNQLFDSIGLIFSIPFSMMYSWYTVINLILSVGVYSFIFFRQVIDAPKKPFLTGLLILMINLIIYYLLLGIFRTPLSYAIVIFT